MWFPHVTVAAVIENSGKFLLVEELVDGCKVLNQPAGHLEEHESLLEAVRRETKEESGYDFQPESITGIYQWQHPQNNITYLRVCFTGKLTTTISSNELDKDILRYIWLSYDELMSNKFTLRSPLVQKCIDDFLAGQRYPLHLIQQII